MVKVGIIICENESKVCCGSRCFEGIEKKNGSFANTEEKISLVGYNTCGGCPGTSIKAIAENMVKFAGAEVIYIGNCILSESDRKYEGLSEEDMFQKMKCHPKKRLNDELFLKKRAHLLASKQKKFYCPHKKKMIEDIKSLGVSVVEGTHGKSKNLDFQDGNQIISSQKKLGANIFEEFPIIFYRGEGVWLYDINEKKYLDCLSGYGAVNQGHCHPYIQDVLIQQAKNLTITSGVVFNDKVHKYFKTLERITGCSQILSMNSGSEAVEVAIKIMRKWGYVSKNIPFDCAEIIVFDGNYHGRTTTITGLSSNLGSSKYFGPYSKGFTKCIYNSIESLEALISDNTCGVLIEPIQCENKIFIPSTGYLQSVAELCKKKGILLCVDEIQTGLGRTGRLFCFQHEEIVPDLVLIGKSLSGGFIPISAVLSFGDVMKVLSPGDHGGTFINNPLAAAVATAALEVIDRENLVKNADEMGVYLEDNLNKLFSSNKKVRRIFGKGLLYGIELSESAKKYCEELWKEGVFCKSTHDNIIRLMPPLCITQQEIDFLLNKLEKVFFEYAKL